MPKTVRVRIPVAVASDGDWFAVGWKGGTWRRTSWGDYMDHDDGYTSMEPPIRKCWVEAEVPYPEQEDITEVAGQAMEAEDA